MRLVLDGVFNHSGDSHAWFDRHNRSTGGACHHPDSPWRDWYSFSPQGVALDWLGYPSLPKLDYQSETLVDEIYRGEDSIVRHWLKRRGIWTAGGWMSYICWARRAGRATICSTSPALPGRQKKRSPKPILWGTFRRCAAVATGRCGRCRHELSRLHLPAMGISRQY